MTAARPSTIRPHTNRSGLRTRGALSQEGSQATIWTSFYQYLDWGSFQRRVMETEPSRGWPLIIAAARIRSSIDRRRTRRRPTKVHASYRYEKNYQPRRRSVRC